MVHSDAVLCTASDAAVTMEPVAGTHAQHCLLTSCSVTAGRESKQSAGTPVAVPVKASTNTTSFVLIAAIWYVPQAGQDASEHVFALAVSAATVTLSPTAKGVVIPTVMPPVANVLVAGVRPVAATAASVAAFTACQPVVASPVGASIQVRAFHAPPRTDAQLASVASVVIHASAPCGCAVKYKVHVSYIKYERISKRIYQSSELSRRDVDTRAASATRDACAWRH